MTVVQLALDISLDPLYRWENYFISDANIQAVAWIQKWPQWTNRSLIIHGPSGCGKTHLAHLWRHESRACFVGDSVPGVDQLSEYVAKNSFLILEKADEIQDHHHLLHLYNLVHEFQGYLIMTARTPPQQWDVDLRDLSSRMSATPSVEILKPDDDLLEALLIKGFSDRQLRVNEGVTSYLLKRLERSYTAVQDLIERLDSASLQQGKNVSLSLARRIVQNLSEKHVV